MTVLERYCRELSATRTVYAVERVTGAIRPMSVDQYIEAESAELLAGYVVRMSSAQAQATSARIMAESALLS